MKSYRTMNKATRLLASILSVFLLVCTFAMSTHAQEQAPSENASAASSEIEPRAYVDDVISVQIFLQYSDGTSTLVDTQYKRITYFNGYKIDRILPEDITTLGDLLNNCKRIRMTYSYTTW